MCLVLNAFCPYTSKPVFSYNGVNYYGHMTCCHGDDGHFESSFSEPIDTRSMPYKIASWD